MAENTELNTDNPIMDEVASTEISEKTVPLSELVELRSALSEQRRNNELMAEQMRNLMSAQQRMLQEQSKKDLAPKDPEIAKALDPYLAPILEDNEALKRQIAEFNAQKEQMEAQRYVERNVPYLNSIREDLSKELQGMSEERRNRILADPDKIVLLCERIYDKKQIVDTANKAKKEVQHRGKPDSGGIPSNERPTSNSPIAELPNDEFDKALERMGFFR